MSTFISTKHPVQTIKGFALTAAALLTVSGCTGSGGSSATNSAANVQMSNYDVNKFAINKLVCNPLGNGSAGDITNGLQASLYYKGSSQADFTQVSDFLNNGTRSEQFLFFDDINVPTRNFTAGFPTQTGGLVSDDTGAPLLEWFALDMKSSIQLNYPSDGEGFLPTRNSV